MMPVVDALMNLTEGSLVGAKELNPLNEYLAQATDIHILRAVVTLAKSNCGETLAAVRNLQEIANTPGSGGLPNGIIAYFDTSLENGEDYLAALYDFPNFRGVALHQDLQHPQINRSGVAAVADKILLIQRYKGNVNIQVNLKFLHKSFIENMDFLIKRCSPVRFVVNFNCAGESVNNVNFSHACDAVTLLCGNDNVSVVVGGYYSAFEQTTDSAFARYIRKLTDLVGFDRIMFGSSYPDQRQNESVGTLWRAYSSATTGFTASNRDKLLRRNAIECYRI